MQINLKDKLRSLRLQKNITQEALANHLGITPQSVGKWERGEGFPDITLLPRIAFYFDITVDELLCVDQVRVEEAIAEYERQAAIYQKNGENEKNLELWEQAYAEFPNDCRAIEGLMFAIKQRCGLSVSKGQSRTYYFTWREAFTENHRRKAKRKRTSVPLLHL